MYLYIQCIYFVVYTMLSDGTISCAVHLGTLHTIVIIVNIDIAISDASTSDVDIPLKLQKSMFFPSLIVSFASRRQRQQQQQACELNKFGAF